MDIKMVKIDDIVPYENNPRHNADAVEPVKESIRQFGFRVPMILDKENVIVAGHTRYEAAKALGMTEVPVIYADNLSEEQVRKFRLVDNKTSEFASWDFDKLEEELDNLSWDGGDILLQRHIFIDPDEDYHDLWRRIFPVGVDMVVRAVDIIGSGEAVWERQDGRFATWEPSWDRPRLHRNELIQLGCG